MHISDDAQYRYWSTAFAGDGYYYGHDPGPVARRAVRYHRPSCPSGGSAVDVGCGEGQDLAFLVESGYDALGLDFTEHGIAKAEQLLAARGLLAQTEVADLRDYQFSRQFDLVLAVNSIQFMGEAASACLDRVIEAVAPGGVLGLSLFAREGEQPALHNGVFFISLPQLMARFSHAGPSRHWQMLETAQLWQWNARSNQPQAFVTLIARRL
jgi:SAM-dependent methyltransferase